MSKIVKDERNRAGLHAKIAELPPVPAKIVKAERKRELVPGFLRCILSRICSKMVILVVGEFCFCRDNLSGCMRRMPGQ